VEGRGPVVLAVDNLPCELPREASESFGRALADLLPGLIRADLSKPLPETGLPGELARGVVLLRGELTPPFAKLKKYL
jgi:saccharopine dehydrogenase (NAD+, L-lysine forming)